MRNMNLLNWLFRQKKMDINFIKRLRTAGEVARITWK